MQNLCGKIQNMAEICSNSLRAPNKNASCYVAYETVAKISHTCLTVSKKDHIIEELNKRICRIVSRNAFFVLPNKSLRLGRSEGGQILQSDTTVSICV